MTPCIICGNTIFAPGPKGRLTADGSPPRCTVCFSLERHRIARTILQKLSPQEKFRSYRALQFSEDPIIPANWFRSYERSIFKGDNSMDLEDIPRRAGSYDLIVCCHVIEHVPDHRKAIRSLVRILSDEGLLFLAYPDPSESIEAAIGAIQTGRNTATFECLGETLNPNIELSFLALP